MNVPLVAYTTSLQDWDVKHLPLPNFLQMQRDLWGTSTLFEMLNGQDHVVPFFDVDKYSKSEPTEADKQSCLATCHMHLREIFGADPNFTLAQVMMAQRHGHVQDRGWKLSFRFWVTGFSIVMAQMPCLINACSDEQGKSWWDTSIYSARRKLGCVGSHKTKDDRRVLQLGEESTAEGCLCQNLRGDEQVLEFQEEPSTSGRSHGGSRPEEWQPVCDVLERAGFRDPVFVGRRAHSFTFTAANLSLDCPCCPHVHESQNWQVHISCRTLA